MYAGGEAGQVYRIGSDGTPEAYADTGGFLYGVTVDGNGNVYGCDMGRARSCGSIRRGAVTTYSRGTEERPLRVPNFSAFDEAGNLYVTDSGEWGDDDGFVFRVAPGGETTMWSDAVTGVPERVLSDRRRATRCSWSSRIPAASCGCRSWTTGARACPELVADLTGSQPDGIALAADGTMFVGCYRPDRVWRDPTGRRARDLVRGPRRRGAEPAGEPGVRRCGARTGCCCRAWAAGTS